MSKFPRPCSIVLNVQKYIRKLHSLPSKSFQNCIINYSSINSFLTSSKDKNDAHNKIREIIIGLIINGQLDDLYFKLSRRWIKLKKSILDFISNYLVPDKIISQDGMYFQRGSKI